MLSSSPTAPLAELPVSARFPNTYASKVGKTSDGMYKARPIIFCGKGWCSCPTGLWLVRRCAKTLHGFDGVSVFVSVESVTTPVASRLLRSLQGCKVAVSAYAHCSRLQIDVGLTVSCFLSSLKSRAAWCMHVLRRGHLVPGVAVRLGLAIHPSLTCTCGAVQLC